LPNPFAALLASFEIPYVKNNTEDLSAEDGKPTVWYTGGRLSIGV
jgi:hypothetical protein